VIGHEPILLTRMLTTDTDDSGYILDLITVQTPPHRAAQSDNHGRHWTDGILLRIRGSENGRPRAAPLRFPYIVLVRRYR
jgi:hypothetical protein